MASFSRLHVVKQWVASFHPNSTIQFENTDDLECWIPLTEVAYTVALIIFLFSLIINNRKKIRAMILNTKEQKFDQEKKEIGALEQPGYRWQNKVSPRDTATLHDQPSLAKQDTIRTEKRIFNSNETFSVVDEIKPAETIIPKIICVQPVANNSNSNCTSSGRDVISTNDLVETNLPRPNRHILTTTHSTIEQSITTRNQQAPNQVYYAPQETKKNTKGGGIFVAAKNISNDSLFLAVGISTVGLLAMMHELDLDQNSLLWRTLMGIPYRIVCFFPWVFLLKNTSLKEKFLRRIGWRKYAGPN